MWSACTVFLAFHPDIAAMYLCLTYDRWDVSVTNRIPLLDLFNLVL